MSRRTKAQLVWTLTVLRNGEQGPVGDLEQAEFRFGRTGEEVKRTGRIPMMAQDEVVRAGLRGLSSGIVALITSSGIEEEAMESGFTIEMRMAPGGRGGWWAYTMLAGHESWGPNYEYPRSVYACTELEGTVEFADVGSPCSYYNQLPRRLWIRVSPLTMPVVAWAITNGIFSSPKGDQRTLHDWVDLSAMGPRKKVREMVLPGPPHEAYTFFSGL